MKYINIVLSLFLLALILLINVTTFNKLLAIILLLLIYYYALNNKLGEDFSIKNISRVIGNRFSNKKNNLEIKVI